MIMVSVCLNSHALSQRLPSTGVSVTLDVGCLLTAAAADLGRRISPLGWLATPAPARCCSSGIKTIPKKKKSKKPKWLSEEALQIAVKKREAKINGENERYIHLNAEFQRLARRAKAFLNDQRKEIEENNRMERLEIAS